MEKGAARTSSVTRHGLSRFWGRARSKLTGQPDLQLRVVERGVKGVDDPDAVGLFRHPGRERECVPEWAAVNRAQHRIVRAKQHRSVCARSTREQHVARRVVCGGMELGQGTLVRSVITTTTTMTPPPSFQRETVTTPRRQLHPQLYPCAYTSRGKYGRDPPPSLRSAGPPCRPLVLSIQAT